MSLKGQLSGVDGVKMLSESGRPLRRNMAGIKCSVIQVGAQVLEEVGFMRAIDMVNEE